MLRRSVGLACVIAIGAGVAQPVAATGPPGSTLGRGTSLAPLCADVAAQLRPSASGFPPLPPTSGSPLGSDISGPSPGELLLKLQGTKFIGAGPFPWINSYGVRVNSEDADAARKALAGYQNGSICVHIEAPTGRVGPSANSGVGWRLLVTSNSNETPHIAVSRTNSTHRQLWDAFSVPKGKRPNVRAGELLVGYSMQIPGGCVADRLVGITINRALNTFQLERVPGPDGGCPLKRLPHAVIVAVDRSLFPIRPVVFRHCQRTYECSWTYLISDLSKLAFYGSVFEPSTPRPQMSGNCDNGTLLLPTASYCEIVGRFSDSQVVASVRYPNGANPFVLLSASDAPEELVGTVIAVGANVIAMLRGGTLLIRRGSRTHDLLRFTNGLPRANSSGREGVFNADGSRLAVFLQAPGASRDSSSVAVGLVNTETGTMKVVATREWENPLWTSNSVLRVGALDIDAN